MNFFKFLFLFLFMVGCGCNSEKQNLEQEGQMRGGETVELESESACLDIGETGQVKGEPGPDGWKLKQKCCEGLVDKESIEVCGKGITGGYIYTCVACGDGVCERDIENRCNCAEDCK